MWARTEKATARSLVALYRAIQLQFGYIDSNRASSLSQRIFEVIVCLKRLFNYCYVLFSEAISKRPSKKIFKTILK